MRDRGIKGGTWQSRGFARLHPRVALTYIGLWSYCDDHGRGIADPAAVWIELYAMRSIEAAKHPRDDGFDVTTIEVLAHLEALREAGMICTYLGCDGRLYLHVVDWDDHQNLHKPARSKMPPCRDHDGAAECWRHRRDERLVTSCATLTSNGVIDAVLDTSSIAETPDPTDEGEPDSETGSERTTSGNLREFPGVSGNLPSDKTGHDRDKTRQDTSTSPPTSSSGERRGTRIPPGFVATDDMLAWARTEGWSPPDVARVTEAFVDYWTGIPGAKGRKVNWVGTWKNWLRREAERRPRLRPVPDDLDPFSDLA